MSTMEFGCLPTIIGALPHSDPVKACSIITNYLKELPAWPQLPRRSFLENMYVQFSEGFPGISLEDEHIIINRSEDVNGAIEKLYSAYLEKNTNRYPITRAYAAGLHEFLNLTPPFSLAIKGQITGPFSFGLSVADTNKQPIIYDDIFSDLVAKILSLKVAWQEKKLREVNRNTIIFVDEPYMSSFGSAYIPITKEKVVTLIEEVFSGIDGLKGVHCCGNTDWPILLETSTDILSFDTYNYAESLSLYPTEIKKFLDRGGTIAWGIVPNNEEGLEKESSSSLQDRLEEAMAPFTRKGIQFLKLIRQGLLTPSCGLGSIASEDVASQILELLADLSTRIRKRYSSI